MNIEHLIEVINKSNIPAEQKSELIKELKYNRTQDKILAILQCLDISAEINIYPAKQQ